MLHAVILGSHIIAACITGVIIFYALYIAARGTATLYRNAALSLGFVAAFEVLSGTVLALISPELSAASLGLHIALYIGVCIIVESILFMRMSIRLFPLRATATPVCASLLLFVAAVSYGF